MLFYIKLSSYLATSLLALLLISCGRSEPSNLTAKQEQAHTELNQRALNAKQPAPTIDWSLERDNLIKRFKLMNDRSVMFYMYVFIEGDRTPIGYYMVNKVSSVNSQLTNPEQIVEHYYNSVNHSREAFVLPSPAEDGSYGTNGNGVFGFTENGIYLEHNMKYITSLVPLTFNQPVPNLTDLSKADQTNLKQLLNRIK